nr:MAG: hypothetical protein [Microvirus sp.]
MYHTRRNYKNSAYEKNNGNVITIPDQSLTPMEIMVRFARNHGSSVPRFTPQFDNMEDISKKSMEEIHQHLSDLKQRVSELQQFETQKHNFDYEEKIRKQVEEKIKSERSEQAL